MKQKTKKEWGADTTHATHFASGFTLIELLVVIAIIAILAVVVVLTLNPAELLRQSRDSDRMAALNSLNEAINLSQTNGLFIGTSSIVYVSIPDSSPTCVDLGLPALPSGWIYGCAPTSTYTATNGAGWIPINFSLQPTGLSGLPIDPINTTSTGFYYTYVTNGTQWELTAYPESNKYKTQLSATPEVSGYPGIMEQGPSFALSPIFDYNSGLAGWLTLNEGSGTIAYDSSGSGNNATWHGTQAGNGGTYYKSGNNQSYAGYFDGSTDYLSVPTVGTLSAPLSLSLWFNIKSTSSGVRVLSTGGGGGTGTGYDVYIYNGNLPSCWIYDGAGSIHVLNSATTVSSNTWYHLTCTYDDASVKMYLNGVFDASSSASGFSPSSQTLDISVATAEAFPGSLDDIRIYNRALSAAEVAALYRSGN